MDLRVRNDDARIPTSAETSEQKRRIKSPHIQPILDGLHALDQPLLGRLDTLHVIHQSELGESNCH